MYIRISCILQYISIILKHLQQVSYFKTINKLIKIFKYLHIINFFLFLHFGIILMKWECKIYFFALFHWMLYQHRNLIIIWSLCTAHDLHAQQQSPTKKAATTIVTGSQTNVPLCWVLDLQAHLMCVPKVW